MNISQQFYTAMDNKFMTNGNNINWNNLLDEVELTMNNTQSIYKMITNRRQPAHAAPFNALMQVFQDAYDYEYGGNAKVTSAMVKQYFKARNKDFKQFLAPLTQQVEDERSESNESFNRHSIRHNIRSRRVSESRSIRRTKRYMTESARFYNSDTIQNIYDCIISDYDINSIEDIYNAINEQIDNACIYFQDCLNILKELGTTEDVARMAAESIQNEVDDCGLVDAIANELGIEY